VRRSRPEAVEVTAAAALTQYPPTAGRNDAPGFATKTQERPVFRNPPFTWRDGSANAPKAMSRSAAISEYGDPFVLPSLPIVR
jgi:hypothetical protein